ncbi:uncharacterized protein [Nicotiana sylvestris]|uniref:uncharacterized protein n=1 Tax=Nicotiana sylvestris TaxID=4096 RepID=UPI00388C778C
MVFESVKQFRTALQDYFEQRKVQIKLKPNEQHRVREKCVNSTRCRWHILGSLEGHTGNFIVSSYYHVHKCFRATRNKMANTAWVAKHFKDKIINQPEIKLRKLQDLIWIKYGVYMGNSICAKARHQVMCKYLGDYKQDFARIYDYANMLRSTNPGSIVVVKTSKDTCWIMSARYKSIITMLEEIRVKVIERMTIMREFATRWISDVSPMAMGYIEEQSQYSIKHEFKWNGDTGKETYLKGFSCYIQPVTNMEMWPLTQNHTAEPPVITKIPNRPKKNRKRAQDELTKKFGKRSSKGALMTCSHCKTVGHNKKGKDKDLELQVQLNANATQPSQVAQRTTQLSVAASDSGTAWIRNTQPSAVANGSGTAATRNTKPSVIASASRGVHSNRDRVLSAPTKIVDVKQTNIDLGYSAPGLRWQGRNDITQRQLQQQLRRRQTQASLS